MIPKTITYKERKVNYYAQGDISKKTIIFIHGNSLSSQTFSNQFTGIKEIPLLAIDLPGHGLSEPALQPDKTYSVLGFVDVLKFILSELCINDCLLVGHSLGGHIAIETSNELKEVKGVLLFGTPPVGMPPVLDKAFLPNESISLLFKEQLSDTEADHLANAMSSDYKERLIREIKRTDGKMRSSLAASIAQGLHKNELDILKNTSKSIAIIHGENDAIINKHYFDDLIVPSLWQNKVQLVKNAEHCPQLEQPGQFNKILTDFYSWNQ